MRTYVRIYVSMCMHIRTYIHTYSYTYSRSCRLSALAVAMEPHAALAYLWGVNRERAWSGVAEFEKHTNLTRVLWGAQCIRGQCIRAQCIRWTRSTTPLCSVWASALISYCKQAHAQCDWTHHFWLQQYPNVRKILIHQLRALQGRSEERGTPSPLPTQRGRWSLVGRERVWFNGLLVACAEPLGTGACDIYLHSMLCLPTITGATQTIARAHLCTGQWKAVHARRWVHCCINAFFTDLFDRAINFIWLWNAYLLLYMHTFKFVRLYLYNACMYVHMHCSKPVRTHLCTTYVHTPLHPPHALYDSSESRIDEELSVRACTISHISDLLKMWQTVLKHNSCESPLGLSSLCLYSVWAFDW